MHSINQCNLSGNRTCNRSMRGNHLCLCGHSGMRSFNKKEPTASLRVDPESQSRQPDLLVSHSSPIRTWLSVPFFFSPTFCEIYFTPNPAKKHAVMAGICSLLIVEVTLPSPRLYLEHIFTWFMGSNYLIFYPRLRFPYEETQPGLRRPVRAICRILSSNVLCLSRNFDVLTLASS